jgi:Leucine-rich repeat (LRR) protein
MTDYNITILNISNKGLTKLPDDIDKYTNLKVLYCYNTKLTSLDNLPPTLKELYCYGNQITSLDNLPHNLEILYCNNNQITILDNLPPTLKELNCSCNQITSLDNLPNSQQAGYEDKLLGLPPKLEVLHCNNNPLKYDFEPTLENIRNYNASRILSS